MKFVKLALCIALLAMPVFAQIGPGPISSMNTWRVEQVYALGQVVVRNGTVYQSTVNNNVAFDPTGSPSQWSAAVSSVGAALIADAYTGPDIGSKINTAGSILPLDQYNQKTGAIQLSGGATSVYYFATPIILNTLTATIDCNGATLVWTGSNAAAAIVLAGPLRQNPSGGQALIAVGSGNGGLRNCNLQTLQSYLNSSKSNTPSNPAFVPSLATIAVNAAGTGYTTGDIVRVVQAGSALGTAIVTAPSGAVTALTILHGGYGYTTGSGLTTLGGSGNGLTVNISTNPVVSCYPYNATPTLPTGIFIGGDPTGTISNDPQSNYGNYLSLYNVHISGFCGALAFGNNTWQNQYFNDTLDHNYWGIDDEFNASIANSGERSTFHGGRIDGNSGANLRNDNGAQFTFDGTSLDYSESLNGSSQWISGVPILGAFIQSDFESVHIEDQYAPVLAETGTFRGYVNIHDGDVRTNTLSVPADIALFQIAGTGGTFTLEGTLFNLQHVVTNWFYNPTNGAAWRVLGPQLGPEGALPTTYATSGNSYTASQSSSEILNASSIICWNNDTGIFRNAGSGVIAFGTSCNSPNGNGILQFATLSLISNISKVDGIITAGSIGVPVVVASPTRVVGQTASIAATALQCNGAICPAGFYRIHLYSEVTTAGSAGTLTASCGYTGAGAAITTTPINSNTGVNTGISLSSFATPLAVNCDIYTTGVANITYSTTVTGATGSPQYDLSVYMERLQ